MLKADYNSFMNLMKETYDEVYTDEKDEFNIEDALVLNLLALRLNSLCAEFKKELEKEIKNEREEINI